MEQKVKELKRSAIEALYAAQSGHPGSALSIMDMLVALYYPSPDGESSILQHDPASPQWEERDYFLLSNGHACPGWYAVLADRGYFSGQELTHLRQLNAGAQGHPHRGSLPGVEMSSGSLGQGLSVGIGLASALQLAGQANRVFVMMSDGEQEEGSTWEAIMYAGKAQLPNLTAIVDKNQFQIDGATADVMPSLDPLGEKYRAFGWDVLEVNGHDLDEILPALQKARVATRATVIISHTIRGKGVSFMEGSPHWHAGALTREQYETALKELS